MTAKLAVTPPIPRTIIKQQNRNKFSSRGGTLLYLIPLAVPLLNTKKSFQVEVLLNKKFDYGNENG